MTLSAAIMAHPRREAMVGQLVDDLDRPAQVVWDTNNDRHTTGARAMEAFDPSASHHLVIQDDAVVCRDLIAGAEVALKYVPQDVPVCLYLGRVRPFAGPVTRVVQAAGDASWVTMSGLYWGVAVILPTTHIEPMLDWYRGPKGQRVKNYDRRMSTWYAGQKISTWYSWPSLVDHRGDDSLVAGRGGERHAHRFVGETESALDVDWDAGVLGLPRTEQLDRQRQRAAVRV